VVAAKVFYLGPSGSGSKAKLASNLVLGLNRLALAEGLIFAEKLGLDLEAFLELLKVTPAYSAIMDTKGEKMLKSDFTPQARLRQHHKDVSLILKYAEQAGQELPLSKVHLDVLQKAIESGDADLDNSAVIKELRRRTIRPSQ
jgi:3-hydroxyisobutyrate dehydrogenase-like beta-hydroxyacid dehydrogenase